MTNICFIGLGHMGNPMVKNLLKANYPVTVYDVNSAAMNTLISHGAISANSVIDAVKEADVIFTMLQTGEQVSQTCLSSEGIFKHAKKDILYIDCSSIEIKITRQLHNEAEKYQINMLDAPVSGGVASAEAGSLTIMVGGSEFSFNKALTYLEKLGSKVIHAGAAGLGQAAKICNNLILGISMIAVSEGFTLAENLGLDPKKFFEISSNASGQCWAMTRYCPVPNVLENVPANHNYRPGFTAKMMLKDLGLAEAAAEESDTSLPLGMKAEELYQWFVHEGHGELDFSGIIKILDSKIVQ